MSDQMLDDAYIQGLGSLAAIGRGERASVGQSLSAQAQQSGAQAQADASASLMEQQGNAALGAQLAGFGLQQGLSRLPSMTASSPSGLTTGSAPCARASVAWKPLHTVTRVARRAARTATRSCHRLCRP